MRNLLPVAYDARFAIEPCRGMGHFLRFLIEGRERKFVGLCANREADPSLSLQSRGYRNYLLWEQISLPRLVAGGGFQVLIAPYNTAPLLLSKQVRLVLVVHDMIFLDRMVWSPSMYQNIGRIYRRAIVPKAISRADVIITVSHYVRSEIIARFGVPEDKIHVIPNTLDDNWCLDPASARHRDNYVLLVTGEAPSKNLIRAINAYAILVKRMGDDGRKLKVVGVKPKYHRHFRVQARSLGIEKQVEFFGHVPRMELQALYQNAELFVMPSLAEGFGIPLLEAMACGTPIAASGTTSLPEVCGKAALYFDPKSIEEMADCMCQILSDDGLQAKLREEGLRRVREFHPDLVREKVKLMWDQVLGPERETSST